MSVWNHWERWLVLQFETPVKLLSDDAELTPPMFSDSDLCLHTVSELPRKMFFLLLLLSHFLEELMFLFK